jgi:hypothetical protein
VPVSQAPAAGGDGKSKETAIAVPKVNARAAIAKLPKGTWVIDPRDGLPKQVQ